MGYTITQIEDAIITTLKASAMNAYCRKIDSYQIESGDLEEQIRIFSGFLPCALVVYSGGDYAHHPNKQQDKEMLFYIFICAQSMRGLGDPRRATVGTYKMLDDLRSILTGSKVGLVIEPLMPVREEMEVNTKMFSAYSMKFKTKCRFTL